MPQRPSRFGFTITTVTILHVLLIALLVLAGARSCISRKPPPTVLPIDFIVAVDDGPLNTELIPPKPDPAPPKPAVDTPKPPEPKIKEPDPIPIPDKKKDPIKKPEVKKKTDEKKKAELKKDEKKKPDKTTASQKPAIEKGRRITAPNPNPPPPNYKKLSQEEIARLLALGATPGSLDVKPEGDTLYFEIIRRKLYKAWIQPGSVPKNLTTEVEIFMNASGDILSRRMIRASGNAVMDQSVMEAVQSVPCIEGLSSDFLTRRRKVTITFELTAAGAG